MNQKAYQDTLRTLRINKETHDMVKKYCDENNLKINKWAESILKKKVEELLCKN